MHGEGGGVGSARSVCGARTQPIFIPTPNLPQLLATLCHMLPAIGQRLQLLLLPPLLPLPLPLPLPTLG